MWLLIKDAWRAESINDKFRIWLMPTGWRPADVANKYPAKKIEDVYHFTKYNPTASNALQTWSWIQISIVLIFISYLFANIATINSLNSSYIYIYGLFIFLSVYAFTDLMDRNRSALLWESIKNILGITIVAYTGNWFGLSQWQQYINLILIVYFIVSTFATAWFVNQFHKEDQQLSISI